MVWRTSSACLKSNPVRNVEADQSVRQALKLNLADPSLLHDIGSTYADNGRFEQAEQLLARLAAGGKKVGGSLLLAKVLQYQNGMKLL